MLTMLTFKYIVFLLLVSDVTFGRFLTIDMKKCLKRNGVFPKIGSYCKSYYKCTDWVPVEITCAEDELFNPIIGWCDWIDAFTCLDKPKREECPRENGKFLKPGTRCKSYYVCCNGEPTEMTCPRDSLFDPSNEKCEWPELYTCTEERKRKECPKDNGNFLKTGTDCQQYYNCVNGEPTVKNCPESQIFDPSQGRCEWLELYTCVESISTKDVISSTSNPFLKSSTRPSISTDTTNKETSQYPEVSSPETTIDLDTQPTTGDIGISSIATVETYETTQYPDVSSPETTIDPDTQPITDDIGISSIATEETYETTQYPEVSSPETTIDPDTQPITDDIGISSTATEKTYETTQYPEVSSPETTIDPDTQPITDDIGISSIATEETYETTQYPEVSSPQTTIDPDTQYTEEVKSSSSFISIPDSSYQTSYPYTRSSFGELKETTVEPYEPTSSFETFQPYTKSSSSIVEETSEPVDIWCPEPSGYFPHPTDRHKFVGCIDGKPYVMDCPANLVYNQEVRRCDYN